MRPLRGERVERTLDGARLAQEQRALAEVAQGQRGQSEREPGEADRPGTEVAHVGVEGLAAGDREECTANHDEGERPDVPEVGDRGKWTQRHQDCGRSRDAGHSEDPDDDEPDQHDRSEQAADERGALALHHEEGDEDDDRNGHHKAIEVWRIHLDALDGAQHRDRGRDRAIAIEQSRADQTDEHHPGVAPAGPRARWADEREQREDAALAVIVGAHDEDGILDGDDDDQRPEDQRDDAYRCLGRHAAAGTGGLGGDIQGVERARADVAEHDAHAGDRGPGTAVVVFKEGPAVVVSA